MTATLALAKAELGAGERLPLTGTVFVLMSDRDKAAAGAVVEGVYRFGLYSDGYPWYTASSSSNRG